MDTPLESRPQASQERQWSDNSAYGSSRQHNGDYHDHSRTYNIIFCSLRATAQPFINLWRRRLKPWFLEHQPYTTIGAVFLVLAILAASITPPVYHAVENARANTTVLYWDDAFSTCTRHGKTVCPNDMCDAQSVCIAEETMTVPCWPEGKCCTAACLEGWTCKEDGRCAPGLECRSRTEGSKLVSRCRTPKTTDAARSADMSTRLGVTPASVIIDTVTAG